MLMLPKNKTYKLTNILNCFHHKQKALERGVKNVRIQVRGIGPGRMVSISIVVYISIINPNIYRLSSLVCH